MKNRNMAISLVAGLIAGTLVAVAQTQVSSNNIVGYFKLTLDRGKLILLRNVFDSGSANAVTPESIFGSSLPVGTEVYAWNNQTAAYLISKYTIKPGPPPTFKPATTNWSISLDISRGKGFWLKIPTNAPQSTYTIYVMGQVPTNATETIQIAQGLNMAAYAFPSDILWTNTTLAKNAQIGDEMYLWNPTNQSYTITKYTVKPGPPPTFKPATTNWSIQTLSIPMGHSVWYKSGAAKEWSEPRPY